MLINESNPEKSPPKEAEASENGEKAESMFSPGFRSVAAMAGWDEEAILIASLVVEDTPDRDFKHKKRSSGLPFKTPPGSNSRRKRRAQKKSPVFGAMPVLDLGEEDETSRKESEKKMIESKTNTDEEKITESHEKKMIESITNTDEDEKTGEKELSASSSSLPREKKMIESKTNTDEEKITESREKKMIESISNTDEDKKTGEKELSASSFTLPREKKMIESKTNTDEEKITESHENKMIESITNTDEDKKTGEKELSASSSTLPCMDRLREELSCAICLEICFEPSTTSCGHSFCKKCLRSAAEKCGKRCPKCRQLISNGRSCTVNTVLWNTIQLLFPQEIEARKATAKASNSGETDHKSLPAPRGSSHYNVRNRSIQALNSPEDDRLERTRRVGSTYHEVRNHNIVAPPGISSRGDEVHVRSRRRRVPSQDEDAALALRLQREEFMEVFRGSDNQYNSSVPLARENLRAMASRAMNIRIRGRPS